MQATRTGFRARKEAIDFYVALACLFSLVFEHSSERSPSNITDGLSQTMILHHAFYMQIFDGDDLVFVNQPSGQFMQIVFSCIGYFFMCLCHQNTRFVSGVTTFHFTRKFTLFTSQIFLCFSDMFRVVELGAITGNGEVGQSHINTQYLTIKGNNVGIKPVFSQDRCKILTSGSLANSDSLDSTRYFTMHNSFDMADLRKEQFSAIDNLYALRVLNRLLVMLAFETWVFGTALKEVDEGTGQVLSLYIPL